MRALCLAPKPLSTSGSTDVKENPPARPIRTNTPTFTPMKIIVNGFERVNSVLRKLYSRAACRAVASASAVSAPQYWQAGASAGVRFPHAGQVRSLGSFSMGFNVIGESTELDLTRWFEKLYRGLSFKAAIELQ